MIKNKLSKTIAATLLAIGPFAASQSYALSCSVSADTWGGGYVLNVTVLNDGSSRLSSWEVALDFGQAPQISSSWNAETSTSGNTVTASNVGWNGNLSPGGTASFGVQGAYSGSFQAPSCSGGSGGSPAPTPAPTSPPTAMPTPTPTAAPTATPSAAPTSTPTPTPPANSGNELTIQENASGFCSVEGTVDNNNSGFTGSGFANTDNETNAGINWRVNVPFAENYNLEFRYANGSSDNRRGSLMINGQTVTNVDFSSTGAWTSWTSTTANVRLSAGNNDIRLEADTSGGLPNIDSLTLVGSSPSPAACNTQPTATPTPAPTATSTPTPTPTPTPPPSNNGECGGGSPAAKLTGSSGNYSLNGRSVGGNYYDAIVDAIDSVGSGQRVSIMASGSIGSRSISLPSNITFEVCGTMNVGNASGKGAIEAINKSNISIPHLKMTGSPYFGLRFGGVRNLHLGQIDMRMSSGLGIRFDRDQADNYDVRIDNVYVSGTDNHGVETWNIDGLTIGTVVARNVGRSGLLLNNSRNATVELVDGDNVATGTGYATLRFANRNGRIGSSYATNIRVKKVISRGGGRGIFCVSESGGAQIDEIDLANNGNNSILLENCYNLKINKGTVRNGGEIRIAARSEFSNTRDITISNLTVRDTSVRESPCGDNVNWSNLDVSGGSVNICD